MNKEKSQKEREAAGDWIDIDKEKPPNGVIKTLHTDGKEDICYHMDGTILTYDHKTMAAITHWKKATNFIESAAAPSAKEEGEEVFDIDFIVWYSGMSEQEIKNAYKMYKREIEQGQP